jgi:hypothetical protein
VPKLSIILEVHTATMSTKCYEDSEAIAGVACMNQNTSQNTTTAKIPNTMTADDARTMPTAKQALGGARDRHTHSPNIAITAREVGQH